MVCNNKEMIKKLKDEYDGLSFKKEFTCIKYYYVFNSVHVNVYFDCYDENCPAFNLILIYGNDYYFTPLNINNNSLGTQYLTKIPKSILNKILFEGRLEKFYDVMRDEVLTNDKKVINYENETLFTKTLHNSQYCENKPFFKNLKKSNMSSEMYNKLKFSYSISDSTLQELKQKGYTFVFTSNPMHRRNLTLILENLSVKGIISRPLLEARNMVK